jgi:retinol-binding protein 3
MDRLAAATAADRYDTADPVIFAQRISDDLLAATHDTHLYLRYEPQWFASASLPNTANEDGVEVQLEADIARHTNHGLVEMKILPGNIRYLRIEGFPWIEGESQQAYDGAMRFLAGGRAIIIDLRGNSGGWVQASQYLISHFLAPNTLIATFYSANAEPEYYQAVDELPTGRIAGPPLYVLTDGRSRSAAEMVAYTVQQYGLGELVGARTEGAANVSDDFVVSPGFRLSVSTGRTVHPISNTDWEGAGVEPTVTTDPSRALEVAQLRAIDRLLPQTAIGVPRHQLEWARPALEAELNPVTLSEQRLRRYTGVYGDASVRFADHSLWLHRPDRAPDRLRAMTEDGLFQSIENATLRVRITADTLDVLRLDPAYSVQYRR